MLSITIACVASSCVRLPGLLAYATQGVVTASATSMSDRGFSVHDLPRAIETGKLIAIRIGGSVRVPVEALDQFKAGEVADGGTANGS